jgi:eukaryotic-like serine/threonine-protein kinase
MTPKSEIDPLDLLAEEFVGRLRRGERPAVEEYAARHPDLADRVRDLFPALAAVEGVAEVLTSAGPASATTEIISRARPERVGDYRVLREVGRGGMGVVYEAEDTKLGRRVALKVLLPEYQARGRFLERFRREARAAGRLHHTNIVPVFGVGEADGTHYFVMQFIAGVGLDQVIRDVRRLRRRPNELADPTPAYFDETLSVSVAQGMLTGTAVPPPPSASTSEASAPTDTSHLTRDGGYFHAAARLALQAARALDHAHAQGIVHRDVKPSNMLLDAAGNLWVTDFGLAKTDEASDLTGSHDILGTLRYMAPERFAGGPIDARADIYALGLTLYELLTLRPAFDEYDRLRLIQQVGLGDFRRPREIDRQIPRDLETIVLKAAARDPKDRYRSAGALADDLELFLANRPIKSRRASNWEHLRRWSKRNPMVAGLTGAVAALLIAITALSLVNNARLGRTNKALETNRSELGDSLIKQGLLRTDAQDQAWKAHVEAARGGRLSGRMGQRFDGLRHLQQALELAPGRDLLTVRNEAVGCLALADAKAVTELPWPAGTERVEFSPDLSRYARLDGAGRITVRRTADDSECFSLPHDGTLYGYHGWRFSPDNRYFWHWNNWTGKLHVYRVDGEGPVEVLTLDHTRRLGPGPKTQEAKLHGVDYTADSARLIVIDSAGLLRVFDLHEPDPVRRGQLVAEVQFPADPDWLAWAHPTSPDLVLLNDRKEMTLYDLSRRAPVHTRPIPENAGVSWVAWHPDGRVYAVAGNDRLKRIYIIAADTGALLTTLSGHTNNGLLVMFDPAGDRLWSTDWNNQTRLWDWRTGQTVFEAEGAVAMPPVVGADGSLAGVLGGNRAQVWRVAAGREAPRMPIPAHIPLGKSAVVGKPVVSPDGRVLAAPFDDLVALYDLHARELVGSIPVHVAKPIRFEADGRSLLLHANDNRARISYLYRVPIARSGPRVEVGRVATLKELPWSYDRFGLSDDGQFLAAPPHGGNFTRLYRGLERPAIELKGQHDVRFCSVSPDGRWVISGSHGTGTVTLWDASNAERVADLEAVGGHSAFSRDGHWATTSRMDTHRSHIWDTATWQPTADLPGEQGIFSPDGKLLALSGGVGVVRLVRVPDGAEVVQLSVPDNIRFTPGCFTPDGGMLVATPVGAGFVQAWDLFAIRRQLRLLGLDWDDGPLPDSPPEPFRYPPRLVVSGFEAPPRSPADRAPTGDPLARWVAHSVVIAQHPLHPAAYVARAEALMALNRFDEAVADADTAIRLDPDGPGGYRVRARIRRMTGDRRAALADFERAADLDPDSAPAHAARANLAQDLHDDETLAAASRRLTELRPTDAGWFAILAAVRLVGDAAERDLPSALTAAERAVQLNGTNPYFRTLLGYALLEGGQADAAAKQFAESRRLKPPPVYDSLNLFGLALCEHRNGDTARARTWFAQAVAAKDTGRFTSELAARLSRQMYAQVAEALGLPPPAGK